MPGPTLFLNDFTILDAAIATPCFGPTGSSCYVSAELEGELDPQDFLLDFGPAKKILKALVDEAFDHKLILPATSALVKARPGHYELRTSQGELFVYECSPASVALLPGEEASPALIEAELERLAREKLPANVKRARFRLRTEPRFETEANFRYTHGLRFHEGNCQRLFHGHRNPVEVRLEGVRNPELERWLAAEWDNAHFVSQATLVNRAALDLPLGERQKAHTSTAVIEYSSSHGHFRGELPASRLVLTDCEPSIETLARLAHGLVSRKIGHGKGLSVAAYEGLNKGATFSL
jgi:6-pyruvoyl-tetrahydropterin synthase